MMVRAGRCRATPIEALARRIRETQSVWIEVSRGLHRTREPRNEQVERKHATETDGQSHPAKIASCLKLEHGAHFARAPEQKQRGLLLQWGERCPSTTGRLGAPERCRTDHP